jgi:hypothetical protein
MMMARTPGTRTKSPSLHGFAADMSALRALPQDERSGFFDDVLMPQAELFSRKVVEAPQGARLSQWLQIQAMTADFAVDGISDVTFDLWKRQPEAVAAAARRLPAEARARILQLLQEFSPDSEEAAPMPAARSARALGAGDISLHGAFAGESTFTSARGFPVAHGTFTLFSPPGTKLASFTANCGGGARNHLKRNGPTPPGIYRVSNHRPNRTTEGMVLNGVGFSFDLNPAAGTEVFGRSMFRIHPDGNSPQTNGCIGLRETREKLQMAERLIVRLLTENGGSFKISLRHGI